jgi:hypothetical protein
LLSHAHVANNLRLLVQMLGIRSPPGVSHGIAVLTERMTGAEARARGDYPVST